MKMEWIFTDLALRHAEHNNFGLIEILGSVPSFLSVDDPRGAVEQINDRYGEHGGWHDSKGWSLQITAIGNNKYALIAINPGDPPRHLLAETHLRDEHILFFNGAYIAVVQQDGSHRMARID
jgi:hypothetical protein